MARRRATPRIPGWVRVPGIIILVLAIVAASPMLLDAAGVAGGHGSGDEMEMDHGDHGSRNDTRTGDVHHDSGDRMDTDRDHVGDHGSRDDRQRDH